MSVPGLALAALGLILAVLVFSHDDRTVIGVESDQLASLAMSGTLLAVIVAGFWHQFRGNLGANLRAALIWGALGLALVAGYAYRDEARSVGARLIGAVRPGSAVVGADGSVTITRRADGDFHVRAEVNGQPHGFQFDTGASSVVLTAETAAALGIRPAASEFGVRVSTANGTTLAAPVLLDSVRVGSIVERRVPALVSRPGALRDNLLGMTFLDRLSGFEVRGDRLILRAP
ncbi:retropepsin-like aspartic protease family protein [Methylobacterium gossipiicola]|uniref:Aspartyl protease family protein n=1 Tax=Methylobacterium gossipiicola TaxID=582675 RepID=A0A1I2T9E5_9HYPH|nr:TIGR02281 family clan AA aspartic protease [Methylobacterium gossipiicola]SFG58971.1 aspartyl protease family protein [Methylobacterium gossipiicola]